MDPSVHCLYFCRSCDHASLAFYNKHTWLWIRHIIYNRRPHTVCVKQLCSERRENEQKERKDVKCVSLHTAVSISKNLWIWKCSPGGLLLTRGPLYQHTHTHPETRKHSLMCRRRSRNPQHPILCDYGDMKDSRH